VYQYVLYPGYYSPDHPKGLWHDETQDNVVRDVNDAPKDRREHLTKVRAWEKPGKDPISGKELVSVRPGPRVAAQLTGLVPALPAEQCRRRIEVAPIGGFVKQYQIVLDPQKLQAYNLPLRDVMMAVQRSNNDVGGSVVELAENEYMVRSRAYVKGVEDLKKIPVGMPRSAGREAGEMGAMTRAMPVQGHAHPPRRSRHHPDRRRDAPRRR
jgi:Cu(I)/Ag(I) efflux system membrane protein CusA/SilA